MLRIKSALHFHKKWLWLTADPLVPFRVKNISGISCGERGREKKPGTATRAS